MQNIVRIWIFRILSLVAVVLLVLSFLLPWWSTDILEVGISDAMIMHPYGLEEHLGDMVEFVEPYLPPVWLTPLAYLFLACAVISILASLFLAKDYGRLLLGGVGIAFILYILVATGYLMWTLNKFDMTVTGYSYVDETQGFPYHTGIMSRFLPGYFVAWITAIWTTLLALFRNKVMGK